MQGNHPVGPNSEPATPPSPHATSARLEEWLTGTNAGSFQDNLGTIPTSIPLADATESQGAIGPVNAAEALALGRILTAHRLTGPDGAELVVDPDKDAYYFESSFLAPLDAVLQQPAIEWTPVYSDAIRAIRTASDGQPLGRLRWYAGLIATPGILSRKLIRAARYKLTSWPETEREFPQHFRIAKEMLKDATTVDEVVAASGMPYEEVVDFFNACSASGRLEAASAAGTTTPKLSRRQRLLAVLNKPLFAR